MESLVDRKLFDNVYQGKRVLITGHTGFKGSWLTLWLKLLGADVIGYSLEPPTYPNHFDLLNLSIDHNIGDILDDSNLTSTIQNKKPDIVFHLAAQPLVRYSYLAPILTYKTNIIGTLNLFEACRKTNSVKTIINITTDKCYENKEWIWGYRENDPLGGYDPYSSSKACSEILTQSYRSSYFNLDEYGKKHDTLLASVRAGNVIGGGDWAIDRLIPDIMKATHLGQVINIRNPYATRPWQHVLEPLSGYLLLGGELLKKNQRLAESWNFGPMDGKNLSVKHACNYMSEYWNKMRFNFEDTFDGPHEANLLKLDCSKANSILRWEPVWDDQESFKKTTSWYKNFYEKSIINTHDDLKSFIESAIRKQRIWTR